MAFEKSGILARAARAVRVFWRKAVPVRGWQIKSVSLQAGTEFVTGARPGHKCTQTLSLPRYAFRSVCQYVYKSKRASGMSLLQGVYLNVLHVGSA